MAMAIVRFPWFSMLLLLAAYTVLGKFLTEASQPRSMITPIAVAVPLSCLLAFYYIHPLNRLGRFIRKRFQSDMVAVMSLVMLAAAVSVFLNWFKLFLPGFMILSTEALARLDLKIRNFKDITSFIVLSLVAWCGLGAGWYLHRLL